MPRQRCPSRRRHLRQGLFVGFVAQQHAYFLVWWWSQLRALGMSPAASLTSDVPDPGTAFSQGSFLYDTMMIEVSSSSAQVTMEVNTWERHASLAPPRFVSPGPGVCDSAVTAVSPGSDRLRYLPSLPPLPLTRHVLRGRPSPTCFTWSSTRSRHLSICDGFLPRLVALGVPPVMVYLSAFRSMTRPALWSFGGSSLMSGNRLGCGSVMV